MALRRINPKPKAEKGSVGVKTNGMGRGGPQGHGNGNGAKPNSNRIQEIAGGAMFAAIDLSSVVWVAMSQIAVNGTFYMPAAKLAALIYKLRPDVCRRGKPPSRQTIYLIWRRLEERKLIRCVGHRRSGGTKVWEIGNDTALEFYARFSEAWREVTGVRFS